MMFEFIADKKTNPDLYAKLKAIIEKDKQNCNLRRKCQCYVPRHEAVTNSSGQPVQDTRGQAFMRLRPNRKQHYKNIIAANGLRFSPQTIRAKVNRNQNRDAYDYGGETGVVSAYQDFAIWRSDILLCVFEMDTLHSVENGSATSEEEAIQLNLEALRGYTIIKFMRQVTVDAPRLAREHNILYIDILCSVNRQGRFILGVIENLAISLNIRRIALRAATRDLVTIYSRPAWGFRRAPSSCDRLKSRGSTQENLLSLLDAEAVDPNTGEKMAGFWMSKCIDTNSNMNRKSQRNVKKVWLRKNSQNYEEYLADANAQAEVEARALRAH